MFRSVPSIPICTPINNSRKHKRIDVNNYVKKFPGEKEVHTGLVYDLIVGVDHTLYAACPRAICRENQCVRIHLRGVEAWTIDEVTEESHRGQREGAGTEVRQTERRRQQEARIQHCHVEVVIAVKNVQLT